MRSKFTLLEMLVVMALIAILCSMLMPAVQKARASSLQAACSSNLRQLDMAFQLYASDYRDRLMPYITGGTTLQHPGTNWTRYIYPYYQDIKLLSCPASPNAGPDDSSAESLHLYDGNYAWNYDGTQGHRGPLCGHLKEPSASYIVFDSGDQCVIYGKNDWKNLMEELDLDWDSHNEGCNRHRGQVNIAFGDGHVASRDLAPFLAAPNQSFAPPWCLEWEVDGGVLQLGEIPFPKR
jgi:prepilin-type processing-associated H-X9-DG protein/prepilin-type N-terminal cleavage/methylation domain-containing protein